MTVEKVQGQLKFNISRLPLIGSWPACEVIGVSTRLPSGLLLPQLSSSPTFPIGPNTYRMCPSPPLPSLAKCFPPASVLLMIQSLQHGGHPPRNFYLKLVSVYFASVLCSLAAYLVHQHFCYPSFPLHSRLISADSSVVSPTSGSVPLSLLLCWSPSWMVCL